MERDSSSTELSEFQRLLREELLGDEVVDRGASRASPGRAKGKRRQVLAYSPPCKGAVRSRRQSSENVAPSPQVSPAAVPGPSARRIATSPFKVLEAPALADDFYLDLVDWSANNVLAVGLGSKVYLWSACTSKVAELCDVGPSDAVASVAWTQGGGHLAVGSRRGAVGVWDATRRAIVRDAPGHSARVGCLHWRGDLLASGSRDKTVCLHDVREPASLAARLHAHKQEVCGLKWSPCGNYLATGGNDNKLLVWAAHALPNHSLITSPSAGPGVAPPDAVHPVCRFGDHCAAVKAIAWSPHHRGLLASGAGTADRSIKLWNAHTHAHLDSIETGSQVCALLWSKTTNELVSSHGFSLNQICIWRFDKLRKPTNYATLTGHTNRVLYLAMSPDGTSMVTGAGDETLRFWNCFPACGGNRAHAVRRGITGLGIANVLR